MLNITDIVSGKLLLQMGQADPAEVRIVLGEIDRDPDPVFDLINRFHRAKKLDGKKLRRLRAFVALYQHVRSESLFLRRLETRKLVEHDFLVRLLALIESECYRRRIGEVLIGLGKLTPPIDIEITRWVIKRMAKRDKQIIDRYRKEGFRGAVNPLVPDAVISPQSFRISSIFRSNKTRSLVRRHLKENKGEDLEKLLADEKAKEETKPVDVEALFNFNDFWQANKDEGPRERQPPASTTRLFSGEPLGEAEERIKPEPIIKAEPAEPAYRPAMLHRAPAPPAPTAQTSTQRIAGYSIVSGPFHLNQGRSSFRAQLAPGAPEVLLHCFDARQLEPDEMKRFERQASVMERLKHPNCLSLIERESTPEGVHIMVVPAIDSNTLSDKLRLAGACPIEEAFSIADGILAALQAIHEAGFVYRSLQPGSILLVTDPQLRPVLTDFRMAWVVDDQLPGPEQAFRTRADELIGEAAYLAPECLTNDPVDARSDLYSLGIVLFEMLTGKRPFAGSTPQELIGKHLIAQPYSLAEAAPKGRWHPGLERFIATLLSKARRDRLPSAAHARAVLAALREPTITAFRTVPEAGAEGGPADQLQSGVFNKFFKMDL